MMNQNPEQIVRDEIDMTAIPAGASLEVDVSAPMMQGTFYAYITDDSSGDVLGYARLGGPQGYTRVALPLNCPPCSG